MFALNTMLFLNQQCTAYQVGLNGSVEQASCVPGDVEVKSDPLYSCKFCYYLYRSYA